MLIPVRGYTLGINVSPKIFSVLLSTDIAVPLGRLKEEQAEEVYTIFGGQSTVAPLLSSLRN